MSLSDRAPGTATATATSTATVVGGALAGQVVLTTATEHVALPATTAVATFTDSNATDAAGGFTASINWGDGTTTAGTVSGSNGSFTVDGGHTYAEPVTEAVSVTITRTSDGAHIAPSGNVVVADNNHLTGTGTALSSTTNQALTNVTVAHFTDTDLVTPSSDLSAIINWGDGTATTAGTVSGSGGSFSVTGSHTYASPAVDTVTVTLSDHPGTATATATGTATVTGGALAGQVVLTTATEHVALPATTAVATFTDSNASDAAGVFTASINWGDGTTTAGTVSGSNGSFTVDGGHTYADEGSDPLSVTIARTSDHATTTATGNVVVGEHDALTPHGTTINAVTNQALTNVTVATFTDTDTVSPSSDFTATINWGDGTALTTGTVNGSGGSFSVTGSHIYTSPTSPTDTVTVVLSDRAPGTATATATSTATVVGGTLAGQVVLTTATEHVAVVAGTAVATFTDSNTTDAAGGFTASINWGDGTTTNGTVSGSSGSFTVAAGTGGHTYADEGSDPLSVTITRASDHATATATGNVVVGEHDALTPHGTTINAVSNQALTNVTVATFTDTDLVSPSSDFTATINWGDGTATTGGTVNGSAGSFSVTGSHIYTSPTSPTDTVTVVLSDRAPGTATATATSTATVVGGTLAGQVVLTTATEHVAVVAGTAVATFTDSNTTDAAGGFTASINWGDGTTTNGTVSGSSGSFTVAAGTGGHTYADEGSDPLSVTITRASDHATATATGNVVVGEHDQLSGTGTALSSNTNQALTNVTVATFTDTDLVSPSSDFTATINWGDGTATTGGTVNGSAGSFSVTGSHAYTSPGIDTVTVTLSDKAPGTATATATSTATVGILLGDANGNGIQDNGETTLSVPWAAAQQLLNASDTNPDVRVSMMKQALQAQLKIDGGEADPGLLPGGQPAGHDLITEAVDWLRGVAPFVYSPTSGNVDINHDGILETGTTNLGNDYNTTTQAFTTPLQKSTMNSWQQYVDTINSPPQTGDVLINGQDLRNALAAFNTTQLVTLMAGSVSEVGWNNGSVVSDVHPNTANTFLTVLADNHVIAAPTHA